VTPTSVLNTNRATGSVSVRAPDTNIAPVFIGFDDDVTRDNGFPLYPRDAVGLDLNLRQQEIYVVAAEDADEVRYIVTN